MSAQAQAQTALLIGATGAVGKHLLKELLDSSQFTRVGELGRRTTPLDGSGLQHTDKLVQRTIDFEKLDDARAGLTDEKWDVVFITMGTSRKHAGGLEQFRKIDQEYVVDIARVAKHPEHKQRIIYVSGLGANPRSYSYLFKSKGQTEERLASLGYSDTIVFRPSKLLEANRSEFLPLEYLSQIILAPLTALTDKAGIAVSTLAKSICIAGELGSSALPSVAEAYLAGGQGGIPNYTIVSNKGAVKLARTRSSAPA